MLYYVVMETTYRSNRIIDYIIITKDVLEGEK